MNKIIVSQEKILQLKDETAWLSIMAKEVSLMVMGNVVIYDCPMHANTKKVHITLCDGAALHYYRFSKGYEEDIDFEIVSKENSQLSFQYSLISTSQNNIIINNTMECNHAKSNILVAAVCKESGKVHLNANGNIHPYTIGNDFTENLRIFMQNDEEQSVIPDLEVATSEVVANHFTTISSVDEDSLFYFMGKGLTKGEATQVIEEGFLLQNIPRDTEFYEQIKKQLS